VFLFETTQAIEVAFDKNVVTSLNATDLMVQSIGSGATISPSSVDFTAVGNVATFSFGTILADGNYRATLPVGAVADAVGNVNTSPYTITFFVLTGDLNRDREVTISDFIDLASHFNQFPATWSEGDLNYDNAVTISDFIDLASNFNQSLAGTGIAIDSPQPALSTTESVLDESLLLTSADPLATIQAKRHPPKPHRHHRSHAPRPQLPLPARY